MGNSYAVQIHHISPYTFGMDYQLTLIWYNQVSFELEDKKGKILDKSKFKSFMYDGIINLKSKGTLIIKEPLGTHRFPLPQDGLYTLHFRPIYKEIALFLGDIKMVKDRYSEI